MKAILASDWHIGLTKPKNIQRLLEKIQERVAEEDIKVFIMLGDYCGGNKGSYSVNAVSKMIRDFLPDVEYLATLGNHDFWTRGQRVKRGADGAKYIQTNDSFHENYAEIVETFKKYRVHFLDLDGPWRDGDFTAIVGHTLWYQSTNPPSNDYNWIPPFIDGVPFNEFLASRAYRELQASLDKLTKKDQKRIFASHFPIIETSNPADWHFSGSYRLHGLLRDQFGFGTFLNGHTHVLSCVPGHFCCNSDYYVPQYLVIEV